MRYDLYIPCALNVYNQKTFIQTGALVLWHCLMCRGTVVCRSKKLQPVCVYLFVCGGGEWEERPDLALAGSQHGPLLSQDTPPIPHEGSQLSGKDILNST